MQPTLLRWKIGLQLKWINRPTDQGNNKLYWCICNWCLDNLCLLSKYEDWFHIQIKLSEIINSLSILDIVINNPRPKDQGPRVRIFYEQRKINLLTCLKISGSTTQTHQKVPTKAHHLCNSNTDIFPSPSMEVLVRASTSAIATQGCELWPNPIPFQFLHLEAFSLVLSTLPSLLSPS
jgi:hypothetical protein